MPIGLRNRLGVDDFGGSTSHVAVDIQLHPENGEEQSGWIKWRTLMGPLEARWNFTDQMKDLYVLRKMPLLKEFYGPPGRMNRGAV